MESWTIGETSITAAEEAAGTRGAGRRPGVGCGCKGFRLGVAFWFNLRLD